MRYGCYHCGKSVTSELPDDSVIRAVLICPECIGRAEGDTPETVAEKAQAARRAFEALRAGDIE